MYGVETPETQFKEAKRLLLVLRTQVEALESGQDKSVFLQTKISTNINTLSGLTTKLQSQVSSVRPEKREIFAIKVDQLVLDYKTQRDAIENYFRQVHDQTKKEEQQQELTHRRAQIAKQRLEAEIFVGDSISRSQQVADELNGVIKSLTKTVKGQNVTLKRIRTQVLDLVNQFELSRSVMQKMEAHMSTDKIILFGGMGFIIFLLLVIWWYRTF